MDALIRRRGSVKSAFTRLQGFLDSPDVNTCSIDQLNSRLEKLGENWRQAETIFMEICVACEEDDLPGHEEEHSYMEERFFTLQEVLSRMSRQQSPPASRRTSGADNQQTFGGDVKLPRLDLPKFNGDYKEWTAFHDQFVASVHNNAKLSGSQKLNYLKSCLKDDASNLLRSVSITDANYEDAWDILIERYQNKRNIVNAHMKTLFSQVPLQSESASQLRKLLDTSIEHVRALKVLEQPTDAWDTVLIYHLSSKMDGESKRQWELSLVQNELPTFTQLTTFLKKRCGALEMLQTTEKPLSNPQFTHNAKYKGTHSYHVSAEKTCVICKQPHLIYKCEEFLKANVNTRADLVRKYRLCYNCLRESHSSSQCQSGSCRQCQGKHHTLLHYEKSEQIKKVQQNGDTSRNMIAPIISNHMSNLIIGRQVLLGTAIIHVTDCNGNLQPCRAVLDSASQATFISEKCMQRLGLQRRNFSQSICGIGSSNAGRGRGITTINFQSALSEFRAKLEVIIMQKVTGILPSYPIKNNNWSHLQNLPLADPLYYQQSEMDILLGNEITPHLMMDGKRTGPEGSPIAQNTVLGWILGGTICSEHFISGNHVQIMSTHSTLDISEQLQEFWRIEEMPSNSTALSLEEKLCESHFQQTHTRNSNGSFIVEIPFKTDNIQLGNSINSATIQLKQIEKKLAVNPHRKQQYYAFMEDYQKRHHMTLVPQSEINKPQSEVYYLPHHYVTNDASSTTKLRVVFDASRKTSTKVSLNEKMILGPIIQQDLFAILLRFRTHRIAMTADIEKMYRQILISPKHLDYQRILWRDSPELPIQHYRLLTVTYGTASAPYLAVKCLQQLAYDERNDFPLGSQALLEDFYVDDFISGAEDIESALDIQSQLMKLLKRGGFPLRKWSSNSTSILEAVTEEERETKLPLDFNLTNSIKTLGIHWHPVSDELTFTVKLPEVKEPFTKRNLLSSVARIFDPLGWLAPSVIISKLLFQRLWLIGLQWDDALPQDILSQWKNYSSQLPLLSEIKLPRWMESTGKTGSYELHGFSDASEAAYAAVIYFRSTNQEGAVKIHLVCSKTKVAPIKQVSLPRLELCGALLLARLMNSVKNALGLQYNNIYSWTDSTIVLAWISSHPNRWKNFVANRVSEIQDIIPPEQWNHVISQENPADCATRGVLPADLHSHPLWWKGPDWLLKNKSAWKMNDKNVDDSILPEQRKIISLVAITKSDLELFSSYSSLTKLIRVITYCKRFSFNSRRDYWERTRGFLSTNELQASLFTIIRMVQSVDFTQEIQACLSSDELPTNSKLKSLNPFIDENGLLRVGGRLRHSNIPYQAKHPIILPRSHFVTELIVIREHLRNFHAGPQLLLSTLHKQYWILCSRDVVRRIIYRCVVCFRHRAATTNQIMGDLPKYRLEQVRPFLRSGVDYAGPITLKTSPGRCKKTTKGYICLFICLSTKAIHLEAVSDLTSQAFLAAFKRFVSRRGKVSDLFSDNGTNFVGASKELITLHKQAMESVRKSSISEILASDGTNWHWIPPASPHCGGLWEAGIKSCKYHLRRIVGNSTLTFEELATTLCQIESCLNSRPLCPMSNNPEDLEPLTPGHFLIGEALTAVPEPSLLHLKMNRLSRWQLIQQLSQHFWTRWHSEYLNRLQQRKKWTAKSPNMKVGDLVILKDNQLPPQKWNLGRIVATHPGTDGIVRVVTIKLKNAILKRSIVNVCPLPFNYNDCM